MTASRWLIAGTPGDEIYPCMCHGARGCGRHCPCRGRTDNLDKMPTICCGRRAAETAQRAHATEPSNRGQKEEE